MVLSLSVQVILQGDRDVQTRRRSHAVEGEHEDWMEVSPCSGVCRAGLKSRMGTTGKRPLHVTTAPRQMVAITGVEEGRIAYDNVRKVIYLLVSTGAIRRWLADRNCLCGGEGAIGEMTPSVATRGGDSGYCGVSLAERKRKPHGREFRCRGA